MPQLQNQRRRHSQATFPASVLSAESEPFGSKSLPARNEAGQRLRQACELLAQGSSVAAVAAQTGLSLRQLREMFQKQLGVNPRQFQKSAQLNAAKQELRQGAGTLDALFAAGYGSVRALYENASHRLGMTPATFGRKGRGAVLHYETTQHQLGLMLVAGTERGVSFVAIGDSREQLLAELRRDYPLAELQLAASPRWMAAVVKALKMPSQASLVPLDLLATAFQAKVWEYLRGIPPGTTESYSAIAASMGSPNATRAVARACATNPAAILIPCHRVVGASGALTGYRWGIRCKQTLLEAEARDKSA
jgi:AraC family transcriptional regulator, regulatory protein of adaptative response / methylated-DNA-[protein]-cysteine methyltransferase